MPSEPSVPDLLRRLDAAPPFAVMEIVVDHLEQHAGATGAALWLADYAGRSLELVRLPGASDNLSLPIDGDPHGEAYRAQEPVWLTDDGNGAQLFLPVTVRAERLGVLEITLTERDDRAQSLGQDVATALAHVLIVARRYTDLFEQVRRRRDLELPAEMQWELLPVLAHHGPTFDIAGMLEPAYDIAGDNFDYAVEPDGITLSLTDAMGHGTRAALLSILVVGAMRNARRRGDSLRQQMRATNTALFDQFRGEAFATGILLSADRNTRQVTFVNAGHSLLYLVRGSGVEPVPMEADLPLGLFQDTEFSLQSLQLEPGDRLVVVSDGIIEAQNSSGEAYGEERLLEFLLQSRELGPSEVARTLAAGVLEHRAGHLSDDATVVCLDHKQPP